MTQVKKTLHLNTHLVSNQLILDFFAEANAGRPFSGFAKDILHEQALAYFNGDGSQVGITPAIVKIASKQPVEPSIKSEKRKILPVSEELPVDDVDYALDNAVESIWGSGDIPS